MNRNLLLPVIAFCTLALSSCELIGDIFEAGVWTGFLLIIGLVAIVGFILFKILGGKKS